MATFGPPQFFVIVLKARPENHAYETTKAAPVPLAELQGVVFGNGLQEGGDALFLSVLRVITSEPSLLGVPANLLLHPLVVADQQFLPRWQKTAFLRQDDEFLVTHLEQVQVVGTDHIPHGN